MNKTLNAYISNMNAEFDARMKAEGATWWAGFGLNANDLARYGVYTVEQFKVWMEENDRQEAEKEAREASYDR
jgi:hypothetical protein